MCVYIYTYTYAIRHSAIFPQATHSTIPSQKRPDFPQHCMYIYIYV